MAHVCSNLHSPSPSLLLPRQNWFSGCRFIRRVNFNLNKGAMKMSPIVTSRKTNSRDSDSGKGVKSRFVQVMAKQGDKKFQHEGLITESLPNGMFRVRLDNEDLILGYISGKIRKNFVRVLPGDRVRVELSPYDSTKGRIVYRLRNRDPSGE
ncbi:hypothetical protein SLE2022_087350 [Rubroshorea leprosula]